ncbi:unnamed protein product, partial [Closterium sp. NIES-54]
TFTLPASPQQNGIAERRIGMVMDVARTSMIYAAAPHFLWPFAVQYAAHQLNLQPRVSLPETSPTLRWTGKVGDASTFRDVTFDKSVPYYRLFPYRTTPLPPPPLFLAPGPPPVDPLPPQGPAPSGVSQVDEVEPVEVAVDSGAARGAESGGAEPGGAESARVASRSASSRRGLLSPQELREWFARRWSHAAGAGGPPVALGPGGARTGGTGAVGTGGVAAAAGAGPAGASGAAGAGAAGGVGAGVGAAGASGAAGAGAAGGVGAGVGPNGGTAGTAGGTGAVGPAGAGAVGAEGAAGAGAATGGTGAFPVGSGGPAWPRPYFVPLLEEVLGLSPSPSPAPPLEFPQPVQSQSPLQPVAPLPTPPYTGPIGGLAERREPVSRPASPVRITRTSHRAPRLRPPVVPGTHQMALRPSIAPLCVPLPSPPESSLPVLPDLESDSLRAATPTVARLLSTVVTGPSFESTAASALVAELVDFASRCRLDYTTRLVAESESICPPSVEGECALRTDVLEDRQEEFLCFAAALPHLVSTLIAPEGDPDAPDIPTPRSYVEAIEGPYSSQWQSAMDAEMASWKSTGTYVDEVPPPGANIVSGMWIFRVKRPPSSPPVFKARYVARGFIYSLCQAPREWHDTLRTTLAALGFAPSTANPSLFLRTDTSLPPFYILLYVDDLVFATADTAGLAHVKFELQKRHTCTNLGELRSYLGLQITRDRAQRTITLTQSHMVQQVLQRFDFTYSSPQATPMSARHSLSALPSDESVEPSGPYPELVGCLMYLMTCTRPDLAYPLSILARYVAPGRHRPEHMAAAKRVLRYLCSTSGLGLVLGGRRRVVLTGHADASWADDQATQRSSQGYTFSLGFGSVSWRSTRSSCVLSSSCEAEIYAGAMAAQELRWLTYLLTDLGEPPRSPPVLYVDNKAMLALCREHRLEHRTKHIVWFSYFRIPPDPPEPPQLPAPPALPVPPAPPVPPTPSTPPVPPSPPCPVSPHIDNHPMLTLLLPSAFDKYLSERDYEKGPDVDVPALAPAPRWSLPEDFTWDESAVGADDDVQDAEEDWRDEGDAGAEGGTEANTEAATEAGSANDVFLEGVPGSDDDDGVEYWSRDGLPEKIPIPTYPPSNRKRPHPSSQNRDSRPPSPRHKPNDHKRHAYTADEKLKWVAQQDVAVSVRTLARESGIHRKCLANWKRAADFLKEAHSARCCMHDRGRASWYRLIEIKVYELLE